MRQITYSAAYSRTNIFLTVVPAAVVALALVAQTTEFGDTFYLFALLLLPVVLFTGVATYIRLIDARIEDFCLVSGMNRLRPRISRDRIGPRAVFVTGHHDDHQGVYETYGPNAEIRLYRLFAGTSMLVAVINAVLAGVVGASCKGRRRRICAELFHWRSGDFSDRPMLVFETRRIIERGRDSLQASFPR